MTPFQESVEHYTRGLKYFSVGTCPGCPDCGATLWSPARGYHDVAEEPESHFSWSSCDGCGSSLGGDRHPAHGFLADSLCHLMICVDCLMYHANGELPDEPEPEPEEPNVFDVAIDILTGGDSEA